MNNKIRRFFLDSINVKKKAAENLSDDIQKAIEILANALKSGKKILVCGNGGSAADSQHFVAELVSGFEKRGKSLPAIALTTNTSIITAYSNDFGFDGVFERQVEGLGNDGDVLIGITTSGNSENIVRAFKLAKLKNIKCICLNGKEGGSINNLNLDINMIVPSNNTARIQEAHITIIHILCKLLEDAF